MICGKNNRHARPVAHYSQASLELLPPVTFRGSLISWARFYWIVEQLRRHYTHELGIERYSSYRTLHNENDEITNPSQAQDDTALLEHDSNEVREFETPAPMRA